MEDRANPAASLLRRLIFWDFPRASWPYDLVVALILLFIFATPRDLFHDQPRAASIVLLSSVHGVNEVFIGAELLEDLPESQRAARAQALIRQHVGKTWRVVRVEPIDDPSQQEIKGFLAYTAP